MALLGAFPVTSELWHEIRMRLRPGEKHERSLKFIRNEISKKTWTYIDNSAMLHGPISVENMETVLQFYMLSLQ